MLSSDEVEAVRQRLGRVGVWLGGSLGSAPIEAERVAARQIEALGYGSLWVGEVVSGKEAFAHQSLLLAATERIITGSGIANVWARQPGTMEGGAATVGAAYPGRFILGIGVSHAFIIERSGQHYQQPLAHMARYIDGMDAVFGEVPVPSVPVPRLVAALRPRMLALARDHADGSHPYFVPTSHTQRARQTLGPDKLLVPEQAVVLQSDATEARRIARGHMERYLVLPNYVNNLRLQGFAEEDFADGGSDHLVDAIVAWGDEAAIAGRVQEHLDAGADHVVVQPLGDLDHALRQLEGLAPSLLSA